jgi:hypothetical protein
MFSRLFNRKQDGVLKELSQMLTMEKKQPTLDLDFFENKKMDYSIESTKTIMKYLDNIKTNTKYDEEYQRVVIRTGAYIGEVIRTNSIKEYHWYYYDTACKLVKGLSTIEKMLGTGAVMISKKDNEVLFPLGKVMKYLENGSEDNLNYYVILEISK